MEATKIIPEIVRVLYQKGTERPSNLYTWETEKNGKTLRVQFWNLDAVREGPWPNSRLEIVVSQPNTEGSLVDIMDWGLTGIPTAVTSPNTKGVQIHRTSEIGKLFAGYMKKEYDHMLQHVYEAMQQ